MEVTLTDGIVTLCSATEDDIPAIAAACLDPVIAEFTTIPTPYSEEHAREYVTTIVPAQWERGGADWVIRRDGEFVGVAGLGVEDGLTAPPRQAEIGYWLAAHARGTGVLARAIPLVLDHGFGTMDLQRIGWQATVGNWPSWKAVWRHGFVREGILRSYELREGMEPRDLWQASLLRDDPRVPRGMWDGPWQIETT